jgi:hypothetical protein
MTNNQSISHKLGRSSASIIVFAVNKNRENPVAEAYKSRHRDLHGCFIWSLNPGISKVPKWSDDNYRRTADQLVDQKTEYCSSVSHTSRVYCKLRRRKECSITTTTDNRDEYHSNYSNLENRFRRSIEPLENRKILVTI